MHKHEVTVPVTWGDVDPAEIIFHPQYFYWFDYACAEWLKSVNLNPRPLLAERSIQLLIVEAHAQFWSPAVLDDQLRLVVELGDLANKTFRLDIKVYRIGDEKLLAEGHQRRVYVRLHPDGTRKAEPIPADFFPFEVLSALVKN